MLRPRPASSPGAANRPRRTDRAARRVPQPRANARKPPALRRASRSIYYRRMLSPGRIMQRCEALARHSELAGGLTRVFLSPENRAANELVLGWMREAGMQAKLDPIGNVAGRYEGERPGLPCLMLGSHLDTVRNAGRYDGMLGVVTAIECVAFLNSEKIRLPFALEVIGFGDEEGVRFGTTLLGSRAVAGTFDKNVLRLTDAKGVSLEKALADYGLDPQRIPEAAKKKGDVLAYAELHIEHGPVLDA